MIIIIVIIILLILGFICAVVIQYVFFTHLSLS